MSISVDTMRNRIAETTLNYDWDGVQFNQHSHWINWVPTEQEWQLLWTTDDEKDWLFDGLEGCLARVPDNAICDFYEEQIAEDYEDELEETA